MNRVSLWYTAKNVFVFKISTDFVCTLNYRWLYIGSVKPKLCLPGYYCPTPDTQISCNQGDFCPEGSFETAKCTASMYCPSPSQNISCAAGQLCELGSASPEPCPSGFHCPNTTTRIACSRGEYCIAGTHVTIDGKAFTTYSCLLKLFMIKSIFSFLLLCLFRFNQTRAVPKRILLPRA